MKLFAAIALATTFAFPLFAAPNCAPIGDVHDILSSRFGEEVIAMGFNEQGQLLQWWGNTSTGSWTVIATDGTIGCIVAQGAGFERTSLRPNV